MQKVAVIGLGAMGSTLAQLLIKKSFSVQAWNRTAVKAQPLAEAGAIISASAADAIAASEIIVMCVHDYAAVRQILESPEVAHTIRGKTLVQFTTISPQEAKETLAWAEHHHAHYINGAIQVSPSLMGLPDTTILVSGPNAAFNHARHVLDIFGGNITYLRETISAAPTMDLATLSYVYGAFLGFVQGALFCRAEGLNVSEYAEIIRAMSPSYGEFLKFEGEAIAHNNYTLKESPLSISTEATLRIQREAQRMGIHSDLPNLQARLFGMAGTAGYGKEEIAALIKVMEQ